MELDCIGLSVKSTGNWERKCKVKPADLTERDNQTASQGIFDIERIEKTVRLKWWLLSDLYAYYYM